MGIKRQKGKISREEWPAILARSLEGESLASIARRYNCTAPAIRYIVRRAASQRMDHPGAPGVAKLSSTAGARPASDRAGAARHAPVAPLDPAVRDRVTSDIASFLVALEAAGADPSMRNLDEVRSATDRLMRAAARTRLELERVLAAIQPDAVITLDRTAANGH